MIILIFKLYLAANKYLENLILKNISYVEKSERAI